MAYDNFQNEPKLPVNGKSKRQSSDHLPRIFRTPSNTKFLGSTLDQMIQPGVVNKLNGFVGRKTAKAYTSNDIYVSDVSKNRENYQLEPATVITDDLGNVLLYKDYNDYMNSLANANRSVADHSLVNEQEFYTWNPFIDWDKFTNFREYYWLPTGPQTISVAGNATGVESTYTVRLSDNLDSYSYIFTPDGQTSNPTLTLYRGVKYKFDVDVPNFPIVFRTALSSSSEFDLDSTTITLYEGVDIQGLEQGTVTLELSTAAPDNLWYVAENDINMHGSIEVKDLSEATFIDVDAEIIGKKSYVSSNGVTLSNGMKITFTGEVEPASYENKEFYVEGVGSAIKLISESELDTQSSFTEEITVEFDSLGFDKLPYSTALGYAAEKDYIVINRSAADGNLWSKYNKWVHRDIIEQSAKFNNQPVAIDNSTQANRPILEFQAGLKLFNFGTQSKTAVDLIDDFTVDVFSTIEGSLGYNVDGVNLADGQRILFTNDKDPLVKDRIFKVKYITYDGTVIDDANVSGQRQITLIEENDSISYKNETLLVKKGSKNGGKVFYYTGEDWNLTQQKSKVNQSPLFDLVDENGISFGNTATYPSTTFTGTAIFSYKQGSGNADTELGFPLSYRNITNVGDIVFTSNISTENFTYVDNQNPITEVTSKGYLQEYKTRDTFDYKTTWLKVDKSSQFVIRQYVYDNTFTQILVDQYDNSWDSVDEINLIVYRNNKLQIKDKDYSLEQNAANYINVVFADNLEKDDVVILKTKSKNVKNSNGYYEFPYALERNPENSALEDFTLGEINDHVASIIENSPEFLGTNPGKSNLRDLGNVSQNGRRFLQHSVPMNLPVYHSTEKSASLVKSIKLAKESYAKFKRTFISAAESLGFFGSDQVYFDKVLEEVNKNKTNQDLYYFSDMVPLGGYVKTNHLVEDSDEIYFPLGENFSLKETGYKAVGVYLNDVQLLHGKDYTFNSDGYAVVTATKQPQDVISIYEYESTKGNFIAPTPTKLGLYPAFEPAIFVDTTYQEPQTVIQGHDGSITLAYGDFRDNLLLELEKRIFNNLKVKYNPDEFDIIKAKPSYYRVDSIDRTSIDKSILSDFFQWTKLVTVDYTKQAFTRENRFTYNYRSSFDDKNIALPGFWREIYKYYYDTDRPHTHPWEMLGETIEPSWWQDTYGEAPYTKDNLLLWEDIEAGILRYPDQRIEYRKNYKRPGLLNIVPVDEHGDLISPLEIGLVSNYASELIERPWVFGDGGPTETAWRRSSEFPFALLSALAVNKPCYMFATGFDRVNQIRNKAGNLVYKPTGLRFTTKDIVFPIDYNSAEDVYTSGIINYIAEFTKTNVEGTYKKYQNNINSLKNQLGFKLAGFTDKTKLKLILDSRTPLNKGNVFIPEENYEIFVNTSSPVELLNYSGVIIERLQEGFVVKGYSNSRSYFLTNPKLSKSKEYSINVGGISENFVDWESGNYYTKGLIVRNNSTFYRCTQDNSNTEFLETNFIKLKDLPIEGGRNAIISTNFDTSQTIEIPYGTLYTEIQDVVDFLLEYESYLKSKGFVFDYFDNTIEKVLDWKHSIQEFLFWTLYELDEGSVISLSPSAISLQLASRFSVVSDITEGPNGYTLLQGNGAYLELDSAVVNRNGNDFSLFANPEATGQGTYYLELPMVQTEHVVLLDNETVFNDIIYDKIPGYRQDRIKALGYRTDQWSGSLNIPGFIYDDATALEWESFVAYDIGTLIKHKQFYYIANEKVQGQELFDETKWIRLSEKPRQGLLPNFEYKTNQFTDFYDLDSDNLDTEQQKFAQHIIGYQKRDYLENIINNSVSQYKFYQGMILEKGTSNALSKLFDVLASAEKDSLEFYEEWAVRDAQYGGTDIYDEIEIPIDESKILVNPQPILLTNSSSNIESDVVYRIKPFEVSVPSKNYNNNPFPSNIVIDTFTNSPGYVHKDDVSKIVNEITEIVGNKVNLIKQGEYVWAGRQGTSWQVYKHVNANLDVVSLSADTITCKNLANDIKVNDVIGIHSVYSLASEAIHEEIDSTFYDSSKNISTIVKYEEFDFFCKVLAVENNIIKFEVPATIDLDNVGTLDVTSAEITRFESSRFETVNQANLNIQEYYQDNSTVWIDEVGSDGQWKVLSNNNLYNLEEKLLGPDSSIDGYPYSQSFGTALSANDANNLLIVGDPESDDGRVFVYKRTNTKLGWKLIQIIEPENYADSGQKFGYSINVSQDGKWLIIGSPNASNVKSNFQNTWQINTTYDKDDIVVYNERLWKAKFDLLSTSAGVNFNTFSSTVQSIFELGNENDADANLGIIYVGNYSIPFGTEILPFTDTVNHILVRAPKDLYANTITDTGEWEVKLNWNTLSYGNQNQLVPTSTQPFNGNYGVINESYFDSNHIIRKSIDVVLYFDELSVVPDLDEIVESSTGSGKVAYIKSNNDNKYVIYLNKTTGSFNTTDTLFRPSGEFLGNFERQLSADGTVYGGFWWIDTADYTPSYANGSSDEGRGLVYVDMSNDSTFGNIYYNILDYNTAIIDSENNKNSYIRVLTSEGFPNANEAFGTIEDSRFVIRAPKDLTDTLLVDDTISLYVNQLPNFTDGLQKDLSDIGLDTTDTNKEVTVDDLWDGYIGFKYTKFQTNGKPYEPQIGQTVRDMQTGATAIVKFYQRNNLDVTIFVDNVIGSWSKGEEYSDLSEIEFLAIPGSTDPIYQVDREIGDIQHISLGSATIGKLIVVDTTQNISLATEQILEGAEYWLFTNRQVLGEVVSQDPPSILNNNWLQVYNIPTDVDGSASGLTNQGMFSIYESNGTTFVEYGTFINQYAQANAYLGYQTEIRKNNDTYKAFVHSLGDGTVNQPGKIYFYNKGLYDNVDFDWESAKFKNFKGAFNESLNYRQGDVVYRSGAGQGDRQDSLFTARINTVAGTPFSLDNWEFKEDYVDYVGYIPNDTNYIVINDSSLYTDVLDTDLMDSFATNFDVSKNGDVIVAKATYTSEPSSILIYRNIDGNYQLSQTLITGDESSATNEWQVAISDDGMFIAVSKPLEDIYQVDEGQVFVYKQENGTFSLLTILENSNYKNGEQFGFRIDFDGGKLLVAARNSDAVTKTTFDNNQTIFDSGFTNFAYTTNFQGKIYVYENVNDDYLLGQKINVADPDLIAFGKYPLLKNNNIYVGIPIKPSTDDTDIIGEIYNFKLENSSQPIWQTLREIQPTVDLNSIKEAYLYNTKTGVKVADLDYIDINQGKIAGIVEQEINYKTNDDPAIYNKGESTYNIDSNNPWGPNQIGKVWWNLENARFYNPYHSDIVYSSQTWNTIFGDSTVDVYEWIESKYTPEQYDKLSLESNRETLSNNISGLSAYGNAAYVERKIYDNISKTFSTKYYFWVKDKLTVPRTSDRQFNVKSISDYIQNPVNSGIEFISFLSTDRFVLNNVNKYLIDKDVALNVQYFTESDQRINVHTQYQIISENLETSQPSNEIVNKWFDSLIGYDINLLPVPDLNVPKKYRYGNLSTPRQSWFVNRLEALKQFIERVNLNLKSNLIVENRDITALFDQDPAPSSDENKYDVTVNDLDELDDVLIQNVKPAKLKPIIVDGKISRVDILDIGKGYKVAPPVEIYGKGSDAEINLTIDSLGQVRSATVINAGKNYNDDTILTVRKFSALVLSDSSISNKWSIYDYNNNDKVWNRTSKQKYDTTLYWEYVDWYASGFNANTQINHLVDTSHDLFKQNISLNQTVKISNIGTGGWLLLKRKNNTNSLDYTQDYETIGRQNGTIQLKSDLYQPPAFGYDANSFDIKFYDFLPVFELRIILNTIKDNIFINDLLQEFNKAFFASIRYVLSEQVNVDWLFKTSFVKAVHNVGELREDITFNNDNLADYEDYINEVKPYRSKIREYLSSYEKTEPTNTLTTDFDLSIIFDPVSGNFIHPTNKIKNDEVIINPLVVSDYPNKHWYDNIGYEITAVNINSQGSKYRTAPVVKIIGGGGSDAEIKTYIGTNGKLVKCEIINPGKGYTSEPSIEIIHNLEDGGEPANISIEVGNGLTRSLKTGMKFDRTTKNFTITQLEKEEEFTASGSNFEYNLTWPIVLTRDKVKVCANDIELLRSEYTFENIVDLTKSYKRYLGKITTTNALPAGTNVKISYEKSLDILNAADRVGAYYVPTTGQLGNDLSQLMVGVDYGGVVVKGTGFDAIQGWDNDPWYTSEWDAYDNTNEDEVFEFDQSTVEIQLSKPLEEGVTYNVYLNQVRIDDPNYDGSSIVENPNAIMRSLIGDGVTQTMYLDDFKLETYQEDGNNTGVIINHSAGDKLVIRKSSSDGTYALNPNAIDTELSGGNLSYGNAKGILAEDITIDGDNFVTPITSGSVEEHVPGQVLDSVNIKVYESPTGSNSLITTDIYYGDGITTDYVVNAQLSHTSQVIVKVDDTIQLLGTDYTVDVDAKTISFIVAPADRNIISINDFGLSGSNMIESDIFVSDGSTINIVTSSTYIQDMQAVVRANGSDIDHVIINQNGRAVISLGSPQFEDTEILYAIFRASDVKNYSNIVIENFDTDGSSLSYPVTTKPEVSLPLEWNTVVAVGNSLLDPGYVQKFTIDPNQRAYSLNNSQIDLSNIPGYTLYVLIDNNVLENGSDYTWTPETGTLNISAFYDLSNKNTLEVYTRHNAEYTFGSYDANNNFIVDADNISFAQNYIEDTDVKVITFVNHDHKSIDRYRIRVKSRDGLDTSSNDYKVLTNIQRGKIVLDNPIIDAQYAWVSKNGELLIPNADYYVDSLSNTIVLVTDVEIDDEFIVVHFAADRFQQSFGWQQFKDILNRTHYESLRADKSFVLSNDLHWYDKEIVLDDGSNLTKPKFDGTPGVIWIDGERIEYYVRDKNTLSQLRRGTLGTGVKEVYTEGTIGLEIPPSSKVPYKDEIYTTIFTADGTSTDYTLDFTDADIDEFEVFVGGKRLRKNSISAYQFEYTDNDGNIVDSIAMDSPEGDVVIPAEFTIANDSTASSTLILATAPLENTKIIVIRKKGLSWSDIGKTLAESENDIAVFLRSSTVDLPR